MLAAHFHADPRLARRSQGAGVRQAVCNSMTSPVPKQLFQTEYMG